MLELTSLNLKCKISSIFSVKFILKHESILFTVRNLYSYKFFTYILIFFEVSETTSKMFQEAFKKVSRMIQEAQILSTI